MFEDELEDFDEAIKFAKGVLGCVGLDDEDDDDALDELSKTREALSGYKNKNPGFNSYQVRIPFFLRSSHY